MPSFPVLPEWGWWGLLIGAAIYLYRNGWLDQFLKPNTPPANPSPSPPAVQAGPAAEREITLRHVVEQRQATPPAAVQEAASEEVQPVGGGAVIEKLSIRGPVKINVGDGRVDLQS